MVFSSKQATCQSGMFLGLIFCSFLVLSDTKFKEIVSRSESVRWWPEASAFSGFGLHAPTLHYLSPLLMGISE